MRELVLFTSPTCVPCKTLKPRLLALSEELGFAYSIIEASPQSMKMFESLKVRSVPTFMCVEDGKEVGSIVGVKPDEAIKVALNQWGFGK